MNEWQTVKQVFRRLLKNHKDWPTMLVLADALEDLGTPNSKKLAVAYRWAARNEKWPMTRDLRIKNQEHAGVDIWDWNRERTGRSPINTSWPEHTKLPALIHHTIREADNKKYGGIHRAFMLLANALEIGGHK